MPRTTPDDTFFGGALTIAVQLAQLRHDPAALGRLAVALAQTGEGEGDPKVRRLTTRRPVVAGGE